MAHARVESTRYLTRFRCIADRCEDSCCTGLRVLMSAEDRDRVVRALGEGEAGRKEAAAKIWPLPLGAGTPTPFLLAHRDAGGCHCSFLDSDRLCTLVKRHGEAPLPDTCASYPRYFLGLGETVRAGATLACPEAARLALLAPDAMERVEVAPDHFERIPQTRLHRPDPSVDAMISAIHEEGERLLALRSEPLAVRLALLARFAASLERGPLADALAAARSEQARGEARRLLAEVPFRGGLVVELAHVMLVGADPRGSPRFRAMWTGAMGELQRRAIADAQGALHSAQWHERLWQAASGAFDEHARVAGERLDQYLTNLALNVWLVLPFFPSGSLLKYVERLAVWLGLVRLLFSGHAATRPPELAELDRAIVEVVQLFTKNVQSDTDTWSKLEAFLPAYLNGLTDLQRAVFFARAV